MDFLIFGVLSRVDDALFAIMLTLIIQAIMIIFVKVFHRSLNPAPAVEMILRPVAIFLCDKLNRAGRSDFALIIRGSIVFFILLALLSFAGIFAEHALVSAGLGAYMDILMLAFLLSPISILVPAYAISRPNSPKGSYLYIARALNQNLVTSDDFGLRRAAIAAISLSWSEWVIGPVLFYLIGGMPLVCLYTALGLFMRVDGGEQNAFRSIFGFMYTIFRKLSACISFMFIFASSIFSAGGRPLKMISALKESGLNSTAFFAFAQNITVGGTIHNRKGITTALGWIGPEGTSAKILRRDVIRVIIQYCITLFLLTAVLLAAYVLM